MQVVGKLRGVFVFTGRVPPVMVVGADVDHGIRPQEYESTSHYLPYDQEYERTFRTSNKPDNDEPEQTFS